MQKSSKLSQKSSKIKKTTRKSTKSYDSSRKSYDSSKPAQSKQHYPFSLDDYDRITLEKRLKIDAKALDIPSGAADIFIKKSLDAAEKSLRSRQIITEHDLTSAIVKELRKYNRDFAYVYQNRDKIV